MLSDYTPMAPTQVREPFHRDGWVYEEKVDGWRMLAYKDGPRVRLISRNGRDHTRRFASIAAAIAKLSARSLVIDGEVAIYDQRLRSRFDWLRDPDPEAVATPPVLMAFDLLHQDRRELTGRPLRERRTRLENIIAGSELVLPVRRLATNGYEAWAEVIAHDYEGLVAKDETSLYEPGPTRSWLKVKTEGLDGRGGPLAATHQHSGLAMTLLAELEQFASDHRAHGNLTADATEPARNGYLLTIACSCGVVFGRWITPADAELDLLRAALLN